MGGTAVKRALAAALALLLASGCAHGAARALSSTAVSPVPSAQPSQTLWAGAARVEMTPPVGTPLAGYSRRHGAPSVGVETPLYARALALSDGRRVAVLVGCEALIIDEALYDAVLARLQRRYRLARAGLLLWATHTHAGPGAYGHRFLEELSMGRYDARVFDRLTQQIVEAASRAVAALAPSSVRGGEAIVEGASRNRMDDGGPVDPTVRALRFDAASGAPLALLVTFAAHPTVLSAANRRFSGDYPGALMAVVEAAHPGSVCLFAPGAIADQAPVYGAGDRFVQARALGARLAAAALAATAPESAHASAPVTTLVDDLRLPPARLPWGRRRLPSWVSARFVDRTARLHLVAVDGWLLIGVPCDLGVEVGRALGAAARARGWRPMIIGFADDYIGYVLPAAAYGRDTYESRMSFNGPAVADALTRALTSMMDRLTAEPDHATTR